MKTISVSGPGAVLLMVARWCWYPVSKTDNSVVDTDPPGKAGDVSPLDSNVFCPDTHLER